MTSYKITIPETGESFIKSSRFTKRFETKANLVGLKYSVEILK